MSAPTTSPDTGSPEQGGQPTGGGFCRVSIAAPTTRVDLALPTGVPIAALLAPIAQFGGQEPIVPRGWTLSRLDGSALDPATTVAAAGVREGELLVLHLGPENLGDPLYDDIVEVLGTADDGTWTVRDSRLACAGLFAVATLGAIWVAAAVGGALAGILLGVLAVLLLAGAGGITHALGDLRAGTVLAVLAAAAGAAGAAVLLGPPFGPGHLLLSSAAVLLVASAGPSVLRGADGVFAGLTVTALLGLLGGIIGLLAGGPPARAASVVAAVGLAATIAMPSLALRLSRIPRPELPRTAADLVEIPGQLDLERVESRVLRARGLLSGLVVGCYVAVAVALVVLASDISRPWPGVLAATLGLLVVLRARLFRRRAQVAAPLLTAAVVIVAGSLAAGRAWAGNGAVLLGAAAPVLLLLAACAGAFGVASRRDSLNPRLVRAVDITETVLLLAVVPLVLAVWDVYTALLQIRA